MSDFFGEYFTNFPNTFASTSALAAVNMTLGLNSTRANVTGSGVYQYYPQATSGTVAATGGGYWNLVADAYLLLNSSNVIDASQIGTSDNLTLANGTAATPTLNFAGALTTGLYYAGSANLGFSVSGASAAVLSATALNLASGVALQINSVQVVTTRQTGWVTSQGTATTSQGAINVNTITATDGNLQLVAKWVKGLTDALFVHGLIGT